MLKLETTVPALYSQEKKLGSGKYEIAEMGVYNCGKPNGEKGEDLPFFYRLKDKGNTERNHVTVKTQVIIAIFAFNFSSNIVIAGM